MSSSLKVIGSIATVLITGAAVFSLIELGAAGGSDVVDAAPVDSTTTSPSTTSTSATTTSTSTTTTVTPRESLVIHGTGDVNLDPGYIPALAEHGYDYPWAALDGLFEQDDLTVINLECAPSDGGVAEEKEFVFRCPTDALGPLVPAGIEVANLGNNHSGDYGKEALVDGRSRLLDAGVAPVGAGADAAEAGAPALFEISGWTIAVVGFGGVFPNPAWSATDERAGMRDGDDIPSMVAAVEAAAEVADFVVVTIHWGAELDTQPRPDDVERARAMIDAGADVIFGHHAHRLQPLHMVGDAAVFWGLGNFVWPRYSKSGSTTAVGRAVIHPDGRVEACLIPAFIENSGQPVLTGEPECGAGR